MNTGKQEIRFFNKMYESFRFYKNIFNKLGVYEWVDGSPLGFTSYSPSFGGIQTCVYQTNGLWLDSSCSNFYRAYICKSARSKIALKKSYFY